ncbi:Sec34-like family-domain-containing protein [Pilobolus umbonatus]|nr:Sec34-like family-domain-containing protein [Pilobolus umbonatus]
MAKIVRGISLEEWEEKTRLTEQEKQTVYDIQDACTELPLPPHWFFNDKLQSSPSIGFHSGLSTPDIICPTPINTSALASRLANIPRPRSTANLLAETTAAEQAVEKQSIHEIGSVKPIETLQQFFDWFTNIESEMKRGQEDKYKNHLSKVKSYKKVCDDFCKDAQETTQLFQSLQTDYEFIDNRTRTIQTECEILLDEQHRLTYIADGLAERLQYFNQLEPIAHLFNSPGEDICLNPEFIPMLEKIDECIDYMHQHLSYRDSELYLMRFRQCMTRGITLIKMYAISTIKNLTYEMAKQVNLKDAALSITKYTTLYNVKFKAIAVTIKPLAYQIEKRFSHKEYQSLYEDIQTVYFQMRQQLLNPLLARKILQLGPHDKDLLAFTRNGCAYMMSLCADEFFLFYNFFSANEDKLYTHLDVLTSHLYNYLRPRIIHENDIDTLSELCNIFHMYVTHDRSTEESKEVKFSDLIQHVMEDTQNRLIFRAQMFIHNDIPYYQPNPQDFDVQKIDTSVKTSVVLDAANQSLPNSTAATLAIEEDGSDTQSNHSIRSNVLSDNQYGWYPTLQKTLWILSKLYRCVQTRVFEDLAQEAVSLCSESLQKASDILTKTKSRLDGELFLIKNLLTLKEQLAPFEANLIHQGKTLDFSHVTGSFSSQRQSFFNPNTLIGLAQRGMPRVIEVSLDSRREIDNQMKKVCEGFIQHCVSSATEPLTEFLIKLSAILPAVIETEDDSVQRKPLSEGELKEAVNQFMEAAEERMKFVTRKLREYINDSKMEHILMKPIEVKAAKDRQTMTYSHLFLI